MTLDQIIKEKQEEFDRQGYVKMDYIWKDGTVIKAFLAQSIREAVKAVVVQIVPSITENHEFFDGKKRDDYERGLLHGWDKKRLEVLSKSRELGIELES